MKKKLMFVAAIATMGLGAFLTSCADEVCTCTWISGSTAIETQEDLADYDLTSCKELATVLDYADDYGYFDEISCK